MKITYKKAFAILGLVGIALVYGVNNDKEYMIYVALVDGVEDSKDYEIAVESHKGCRSLVRDEMMKSIDGNYTKQYVTELGSDSILIVYDRPEPTPQLHIVCELQKGE